MAEDHEDVGSNHEDEDEDDGQGNELSNMERVRRDLEEARRKPDLTVGRVGDAKTKTRLATLRSKSSLKSVTLLPSLSTKASLSRENVTRTSPSTLSPPFPRGSWGEASCTSLRGTSRSRGRKKSASPLRDEEWRHDKWDGTNEVRGGVMTSGMVRHSDTFSTKKVTGQAFRR
jgi:hypothetical protein